MAQKKDTRKIKRIIREFAKELSHHVPVEKVILFGSYAKGNPGPDSDLDLVFISPNFSGLDGLARFDIIGKARKNYEYAMDYFGFTPEEYENASPLTTLGEVKETGVVVYP